MQISSIKLNAAKMSVHYCTFKQKKQILHKLKQESDTTIYDRRLKFMRKLTFEL